MPATSKGKRKIHVNGRDFYWTWNSIPNQQMTIMTYDKNFVAYYFPDVTYEPVFLGTSKLIFSGKGQIKIPKCDIDELNHIESNVKFDAPDWSDVTANELLTPGHVRRVIVHIFETLKANP